MSARYADFDLQLEKTAGGYCARVIGSPTGQGSVVFQLPFNDTELENFVLKMGRTRRGVRRIESPAMEAAKDFGGRLFRSVFSGDVGGCLHAALFDADARGLGLRLRLHLDQAPELADIPWEYLYNPALNRFLALSGKTPLVRYVGLPEPIRPIAVRPPLRVAAVICSPTDYPSLDVDAEWAKLNDAVSDLQGRGLIELERIDPPTLVQLQRRLRQEEYHIFHFVGHGGFDTRSDEGVLILEDGSRKGRQVGAQYLGALLYDESTLRLAVLNACEGARTSRADIFAGAAQCLVQQGIPAVIAMQFEITDEAAIELAHEFYRALADGCPVDTALAEARKCVFAQGNDIEWGTPVLYMRAPDGVIFEIARVPEAEAAARVEQARRRDEEARARQSAAAAAEAAERQRAEDEQRERREAEDRLRREREEFERRRREAEDRERREAEERLRRERADFEERQREERARREREDRERPRREAVGARTPIRALGQDPGAVEQVPPRRTARWGLRIMIVLGFLGFLVLAILIGLAALVNELDNAGRQVAEQTFAQPAAPPPQEYAQQQPPPQMTSTCVTPYGNCTLFQPAAVGTICYCSTPNGLIQGQAQ
ncbi:MAG: CHAT domain-containing protein [Acidobacteria bacterium]|nr:CHAT domain-containing protein [Acidobacteriota bacterium]